MEWHFGPSREVANSMTFIPAGVGRRVWLMYILGCLWNFVSCESICYGPTALNIWRVFFWHQEYCHGYKPIPICYFRWCSWMIFCYHVSIFSIVCDKEILKQIIDSVIFVKTKLKVIHSLFIIYLLKFIQYF